MLEQLRKDVCEANKRLQTSGLVKHTWGNVSGFDKESSLVVIKPSGVSYDELTPENMVILDLNGKVVEGDMRPSSDTNTHIEIYRAFPEIGGVVHTHSLWATAWAQAGKGIPAFGTTHADCFFGEIPCTRRLKKEEIENDYEKNCGLVIVEKMKTRIITEIKAILLNNHGPFTWGDSPNDAVLNSEYLEEIAELACMTLSISVDTPVMPYTLMCKHYYRKHGEGAYYGQPKK